MTRRASRRLAALLADVAEAPATDEDASTIQAQSSRPAPPRPARASRILTPTSSAHTDALATGPWLARQAIGVLEFFFLKSSRRVADDDDLLDPTRSSSSHSQSHAGRVRVRLGAGASRATGADQGGGALVTEIGSTDQSVRSTRLKSIDPQPLRPPQQRLLQPSEAQAGHDALFAYDLDALRSGFQSLVHAFPSHFLHCYAGKLKESIDRLIRLRTPPSDQHNTTHTPIAVKAAPMAFVVREAVAAGLGVEAASLLEVQGALAAGCRGGKISFMAWIDWSEVCQHI